MNLANFDFVDTDYIESSSGYVKSETWTFEDSDDPYILETEFTIKCGQVLTSSYQKFILLCSFCQSKHFTLSSLGGHIREKHVIAPLPHKDLKIQSDTGFIATPSPAPTTISFLEDNIFLAFDEAETDEYCEKSKEGSCEPKASISKLYENGQPSTNTCKKCGKLYSRLYFKKHQCKESTLKHPFSCNKCHKSYSTWHCLRRHSCRPKLVVDKSSTCNICNKSYHNDYYFRNHSCKPFLDRFDRGSYGSIIVPERHRQNKSDASLTVPPENTPSTSKYQQEKFSENKIPAELPPEVIAENASHPDLYCEHCKHQFKYRGKFKKHALQHDQPPEALIRDPNYLKCDQCSTNFEDVFEWLRHEKTHPYGSFFLCSHCPKGFRKQRALQMHMNAHLGKKPFKCNQCDIAFAHSTNLSTHKRRIHEKRTLYDCPYCDKKFSVSTDFKIHTRTHTGEKPYQCEECGLNFKLASLLNDHQKRHTNRKDVKCSLCTMTFYTTTSLSMHMVRHSTAKPFGCDICGKAFSRKSALTSHKKIHLDTKEYACNICGKAFSQLAGLYSHRKSHAIADFNTRKDENSLD